MVLRLKLFLSLGCFSHLYQEEEDIQVYCDPKHHSVITFWFQINSSGAKYLLTVKGTEEKSNADKNKYIVNTKAPSGKLGLIIKSFKKKTDSGLYTCAAMNSNKLFFGEPEEIKGEPGEKMLFLNIMMDWIISDLICICLTLQKSCKMWALQKLS